MKRVIKLTKKWGGEDCFERFKDDLGAFQGCMESNAAQLRQNKLKLNAGLSFAMFRMEDCCGRASKKGWVKRGPWSRRCRKRCLDEIDSKINQFLLDMEKMDPKYGEERPALNLSYGENFVFGIRPGDI